MKANTQEERANDYKAWVEKRLHGFCVPDVNYDLTMGDIMILVPFMEYKDKDTLWTCTGDIFTYGFKRGINYAKRKAKKQQKSRR